MRKNIIILFFLLSATPLCVNAQSPDFSQHYLRGKVIAIEEKSEINLGGNQVTNRIISVSTSEGTKKVIERSDFEVINQIKVQVGDQVIILSTTQNNQTDYVITDYNRLPMIGLITAIFLLSVLLLSRWKGLFSMLALILSLIVLIRYIAPAILHGGNPLLISLGGACALILPIFYLGHGWNKKTTLAAVSTFISILLAALIAALFVQLTKLAGLGSEDAAFLQLSADQSLNLQGLLLGGIIIGALGVLDDITITQTTSIAELKEVNPTLTRSELFRRGLNLGREHIASLVNTLALAYVGASFPLFLLFTINNNQPWWAILNSEMMAEEIIRSLVGSMALILAVPITTGLASYYIGSPNRHHISKH